MGGTKKAVKKFGNKIKEGVKDVGDVTLKQAVKGIDYSTGGMIGEQKIKDFAGTFTGETRRKMERAESDRAAGQEKAARAARDKIEKQGAAEDEAGKALAKNKAKQARRSRGSGRRSTILTDKVGRAGSETERKSLLGL